MYWEKNVETIKRAKLEELQLGRLKETIGRTKKSFYYGRLFKEKKLGISTVKKLKDIQKFSFTTKDDLREHWPYGFIAVPKEELVRMHSSSGTTGRATVVFHTIMILLSGPIFWRAACIWRVCAKAMSFKT